MLSNIAAPSRPLPRITAVGTGVPPHSYSQEELLEIFRVDDPRIRSLYLNSAIERRHLTLPPVGPDGARRQESQGELLRKHVDSGLDMARTAIAECLGKIGAAPEDVSYLCCVSSTGFITPGFSAKVIKELGFDTSCSRLDVVGMGCNAGLNALNAVSGWAGANPGKIALMVCIEACSAAYVFDGTMRTSVVNSLFGDGAAAVAVTADAASPTEASGEPGEPGPAATAAPAEGPVVLKFASRIVPEASEAMRYEWDDDHGKFSFFLDREIPYVVGAHAEETVGALLEGTGLRRSDIAHWIVHSGGKKVIDSVRVNLRLTRHDLRHTTGVLADHGNLSSGSFLFSYRRLSEEGVTAPGDHGVLMTMGPGSTVETALLRW
ncbi:3,5-dihydroxyphenylacetyl-CoA synthase DpgA [Streptomyces albireticuli]|uniref:Type III polyketide synthase n=1 Tax=Streptomyces albireticuli TaxID=1940 RepID=A0A2A2D0Z3_9ACTN|nr:3,5-dihydroxyphenylacetyl-CoA synthase DpgA [Streptomyces albireticuli]PAU45127.1 type III polyketide synthase [Streptomyces albireticuli]